MQETTKQTEAARVYAERRARIVGRIGQVAAALLSQDKKMAERPSDWGLAGNLGHVEELLGELVSFMGGAKETEADSRAALATLLTEVDLQKSRARKLNRTRGTK